MVENREVIQRVAAALRDVVHPDVGTDIISAGRISGLRMAGETEVELNLSVHAGDPPELREQVQRAAESVEGVTAARVQVKNAEGREGGVSRKLPVAGAEPSDSKKGPGATPAPPEPQEIPGVDRVIAISSGKGGVGKSTVATNLAVALGQAGHRVGLMDADVYGPNIPTMFGAYGKPRVTRDERVVPLEAHGVKLMSIGFLIEEDTPAIWRGPIVMGIIRQFLQQVDWGQLDYLVVDLPPGTGDAQLSLVQLVKVDGAVMVTTPQGVSVADVLKGIKMFERVEVPVLGIVENMSGFECPHCGERTDLFGRGGGRKLAATAGITFLGEVPLGASVVGASDAGRPTVLNAPDSPEGQAFRELADKVLSAVERDRRASPSR